MRNVKKSIQTIVMGLCALTLALEASAFAQGDDSGSSSGKTEKLNVQAIKEKYWAKGEEGELRVVQNRLFTKANRLEFALYAGNVATDPFLSVKNVGGLLSYHLSEYVAVNAL